MSAVAGTFLVALSPHLISLNSYILSETLFCFLLVVAMLFFSRVVSGNTSSAVVFGSGVLLGLATLTRPSIEYFPFVAAGFLLMALENEKNRIRTALLFLSGFVVAFAPWIIRNLVTLGSPGDNTLVINFLHHGAYPDFTYEGRPESFGFPYRFDPRSGEISQSLFSVLREIVRRFDVDPLRHVRWYFFGKPCFFWSWNVIQGMGDVFIYKVDASPYFTTPLFQWTHLLMVLLHWPLVVLGLGGCVAVWFRRSTEGFSRSTVMTAQSVSLLLLTLTAFHMIGAPFPRYAFPLQPFLFGMAIFSLSLVLQKLQAGKRGNEATTAETGSGSVIIPPAGNDERPFTDP